MATKIASPAISLTLEWLIACRPCRIEHVTQLYKTFKFPIPVTEVNLKIAAKKRMNLRWLAISLSKTLQVTNKYDNMSTTAIVDELGKAIEAAEKYAQEIKKLRESITGKGTLDVVAVSMVRSFDKRRRALDAFVNDGFLCLSDAVDGAIDRVYFDDAIYHDLPDSSVRFIMPILQVAQRLKQDDLAKAAQLFITNPPNSEDD